MTSKQATWNKIEEHQKAFEHMNSTTFWIFFVHLNFSKPFVIHTDASKVQLGAEISQDNKPIACYSRKLNLAQVNNITQEREFLFVVETLKKLRNMFLCQQIKVHTSHKNPTYKSFNTERFMRWRLVPEEFSPELIYIKGSKNIVVVVLS